MSCGEAVSLLDRPVPAALRAEPTTNLAADFGVICNDPLADLTLAPVVVHLRGKRPVARVVDSCMERREHGHGLTLRSVRDAPLVRQVCHCRLFLLLLNVPGRRLHHLLQAGPTLLALIRHRGTDSVVLRLAADTNACVCSSYC